jgi:T4-like virus tail tube protein gp19
MAFNVNDFRSQMVGDGARPNLFQVTLTFPTFAQNATAAGAKTTFMAKAAQLPGSTVNQVPVYYFGRELKFAGNRTFTDWSLQIINDEDFLIRNAMESWMNAINSNVSNIRNAAAANPSNYTVDAVVDQYSKTGSVIKSYKFVGLFPVDLAPIDLGWDNNDSIEEYGATFAFQYWESNTTS